MSDLSLPFCFGRIFDRSKLLEHPVQSDMNIQIMIMLTFLRHGSTRIINYSSAFGSIKSFVTHQGKHKTPAPVEKGEYAVKTPVGRCLDTPMSSQINIGY